MESEDEVEFSDYEIEDLFKSNISDFNKGRPDQNSRNEALDESKFIRSAVFHL